MKYFDHRHKQIRWSVIHKSGVLALLSVLTSRLDGTCLNEWQKSADGYQILGRVMIETNIIKGVGNDDHQRSNDEPNVQHDCCNPNLLSKTPIRSALGSLCNMTLIIVFGWMSKWLIYAICLIIIAIDYMSTWLLLKYGADNGAKNSDGFVDLISFELEALVKCKMFRKNPQVKGIYEKQQISWRGSIINIRLI